MAIEEVEEMLAFADKTGNRYWNAQLWKLRGDSLKAMAWSDADVEACYQQAIDTARQQNGKSLELRATVSLARLWQRQGRDAEAYERLSAVYNWFTEGFDTADLIEAKALLDTLNNG